ncbi:MAG: glycosyltransferase family 39 protein [Anaerolineae bacterium]
MTMNIRTMLLMLALILFGAFTRLIYLDAQSIWADESFTYIVTQSDTFWQTVASDVHPPIYFMLITGWTWLAGTSEFSLRLPSVLASVLAMATLVGLTRECLRHRPHQQGGVLVLIALLLFALSDLEVMVAQEARSYTLHGVWVTLSVWMYLRWIRLGRWQDALAFVVSTLAIILTHYIGVFTPIALGAHALLTLRGRRRWQTIGLLVLSALIFLPWLWFVVIAQQIGKFAGDVVPAYNSDWGTLWYFRLAWLTDQWALMLVLFGLGWVVVHRQGGRWQIMPPRYRVLILFALWIVVPLALAFTLNRWLPVLFDYRLTQITPPILILIAYGLANLDRLARGALIVAIVLYGVFIVDVYRPKLPWETYTALVTEFVRPGQAVISEIGGGDYVFDYYLTPTLPEGVPWASTWQWRKNTPETYESGMLGFADSTDHVWLARWIDNSDAEVKLRATNHIPTMQRTFIYEGNMLEVLRFDRLPDTPLMRFDNGMVLIDAQVYPDGLVDLWWQTDTALSVDYTVSVKLLNASGQVIAQQDIQPQLGEQATSRWSVGQVVYDPHDLQMPVADAQVMVQVYQWQPDNLNVIDTVQGDEFLLLDME